MFWWSPSASWAPASPSSSSSVAQRHRGPGATAPRRNPSFLPAPLLLRRPEQLSELGLWPGRELSPPAVASAREALSPPAERARRALSPSLRLFALSLLLEAPRSVLRCPSPAPSLPREV